MDCFLNMLKRKNIDRVTVTDICEECGINRNTFYYYFSDIYDVLDSVLNQDIDKIRRTIEETSHEDFARAVDEICKAERIYIFGVRSTAAIANFLA